MGTTLCQLSAKVKHKWRSYTLVLSCKNAVRANELQGFQFLVQFQAKGVENHQRRTSLALKSWHSDKKDGVLQKLEGHHFSPSAFLTLPRLETQLKGGLLGKLVPSSGYHWSLLVAEVDLATQLVSLEKMGRTVLPVGHVRPHRSVAGER